MVPLAPVDCAQTWTWTLQLQPMAQMEAINETHWDHEMGLLVEDDCMLRCRTHPVLKAVLPGLQCRCHDSLV